MSAAPEPCVAETLWRAARARGDDLNTAQGRAALDRRLRAGLDAIGDPSLRQHAAEMLRRMRHVEFGGVPFDTAVSLAEALLALRARVEALEAFLSLPGPAPRDPAVSALRPSRPGDLDL